MLHDGTVVVTHSLETPTCVDTLCYGESTAGEDNCLLCLFLLRVLLCLSEKILFAILLFAAVLRRRLAAREAALAVEITTISAPLYK